MTEKEASYDSVLELENILSPLNDFEEESLSFSDNNGVTFLAPGTNMDASGKDMVRMPGTLWCGKGWRTDAQHKMGGYAGADRCCRHHDLGCPLSIEPGQKKWGIYNTRYL